MARYSSKESEAGSEGASDVEVQSAIDLSALATFFDANVAEIRGGLAAELIHGGRSNLTYLITNGVERWVLRRPPLGPLTPSANDVGREYRVVKALWNTEVPVARAIAYCEDSEVIGVPFSLFSMVDGRVIRSASDAASLNRGDAKRMALSLVEGLVSVHAVPFECVGLKELGRPEGFLRRQVARWYHQWDLVSTRPISGVAELHQRLMSYAPRESAATIVHGDYRLDNTILSPQDITKIAAIVDWEMATVGDPLADLGLLLAYWDPVCGPVLPEGHAIGANDGFPSTEEMATMYSESSGRSLEHLDFYLALGYFKVAVIAEGIHQRFESGLTVGNGFETAGQAVEPLVYAGLETLDPRIA